LAGMLPIALQKEIMGNFGLTTEKAFR